LGVTSTSGPGMALKTEMLGLAIATELPLVVVDSQRGGPSTGMPTKAEQSDLFQAVHGRNADAPLAVLAAATATDCFDVAIEAVRIATKYMTPVVLLSDAFLAHAAEPWRIPDLDKLPRFPVRFHTDPAGFHPFLREPETLARPWARPGTPGLEHRIGGLEKDYDTGHISYDPENHARMTRARATKIAGIANDIPLQTVALGEDHGALAVVGWGSTYGALHQGVRRAREEGIDASHIHLRYLNPFPRNLGELQPKDYASDQEIRWCPGCGDYAILKAVHKALADAGAERERTVFVSGIGCAARFPYYMSTYGFHTIHGRAPAIATGIKLANP